MINDLKFLSLLSIAIAALCVADVGYQLAFLEPAERQVYWQKYN